MAISNKLFIFDSSQEGWVGGTTGADTVAIYSTTDGNNGNGCLVAECSSRNGQDLDLEIWTWSGTFEDLGASVGSTISNIDLDYIYDKILNEDTIQSSSYRVVLTDSSDTVLATLLTEQSTGTTTTSWISRNGNSVAIDYPSNTSIKLKIITSITLGNAKNAICSLEFDDISIDVTYSVAPSVEIIIQSYTKDKLSHETGYNSSHVIFQSTASATAWEVRATDSGQSPAQGVGVLIDSGDSINSNTDVPFDVYSSQLALVLGDLDTSNLGDLDSSMIGELITEDDTYAISIYVYSGGVWYG